MLGTASSDAAGRRRSRPCLPPNYMGCAPEYVAWRALPTREQSTHELVSRSQGQTHAEAAADGRHSRTSTARCLRTNRLRHGALRWAACISPWCSTPGRRRAADDAIAHACISNQIVLARCAACIRAGGKPRARKFTTGTREALWAVVVGAAHDATTGIRTAPESSHTSRPRRRHVYLTASRRTSERTMARQLERRNKSRCLPRCTLRWRRRQRPPPPPRNSSAPGASGSVGNGAIAVVGAFLGLHLLHQEFVHSWQAGPHADTCQEDVCSEDGRLALRRPCGAVIRFGVSTGAFAPLLPGAHHSVVPQTYPACCTHSCLHASGSFGLHSRGKLRRAHRLIR